jgi:hypothetical protein
MCAFCIVRFFFYLSYIFDILWHYKTLENLTSFFVIYIACPHVCRLKSCQRKRIRKMGTSLQLGPELLAALGPDVARDLNAVIGKNPAALVTPANKGLLLALVQQLTNSNTTVRKQVNMLNANLSSFVGCE